MKKNKNPKPKVENDMVLGKDWSIIAKMLGIKSDGRKLRTGKEKKDASDDRDRHDAK